MPPIPPSDLPTAQVELITKTQIISLHVAVDDVNHVICNPAFLEYDNLNNRDQPASLQPLQHMAKQKIRKES